jgi:hypothetical protein
MWKITYLACHIFLWCLDKDRQFYIHFSGSIQCGLNALLFYLAQAPTDSILEFVVYIQLCSMYIHIYTLAYKYDSTIF